MNWKKMGLIYKPQQGASWMRSHAQVPTVLVLKDRLRVYFSSRPKKNLSLTTFVDLDINDFKSVLYTQPEPILKKGEAGTFDEHGVMPASVVEQDGLIFLYYSGWQQSVGVPYNNYTGLAISEDGGNTFEKYAQGPVVDRTPFELYSATSPDVWFDGTNWYMWYSSGMHWLKINDKYEHTYEIKLATSQDGKTWIQPNTKIIAQRDKFEAITRPTIIEFDGMYHMWFCYRGSKEFRLGKDSYRMGYASSIDLLNWQRDDSKAGIDVSADGWDSEMIAYPCVFKVKEEIYMFYNGNSFGLEGFGCAILER